MTNPLNPFRLEPVDLGWGGGTFLPNIDVRETDREVHIQADLPGVRTRRDDHRLGAELVVADPHAERALREIDLRHVIGDELGAEALRALAGGGVGDGRAANRLPARGRSAQKRQEVGETLRVVSDALGQHLGSRRRGAQSRLGQVVDTGQHLRQLGCPKCLVGDARFRAVAK